MTILKVSGDGIEDNAITNAHLHSSAEIAGSKIADDAITAAKIADNAVGSAAIANDSITANELANNSVGNSHIIDATITNTEINGSAAISGTKISPNFGSQNIVTTGTLASNDVTITSSIPAISLIDAGNNPDYQIRNTNGSFDIKDITTNVTRVAISSSSTYIGTNVDCAAGIDVTGNISCTGTIDGVDIAARDTLFGGLTSSSGVLTNGVTATTQSAGDNSTKVATTAYTDTAISNLVDSSPSALNTLNELAAALGDDANFSTTVTNSIATKMPLAGGTFSGNVSFGDNNITNVGTIALDTIKGDADDNTNINFAGSDIVNIKPAGTTRLSINTSGVVITGGISVTGNVDGRDVASDGSKLDGIESGATADQSASEILTLIKTVDGAGSGLDADTLDGISSASFLRSDANDTATGNISIRKSAPTLTLDDTNSSATEGPVINFDTDNNQGVALRHVEHDGDLPAVGYGLILKESDSNTQFPSTGTLSFTVLGNIYAGATTVGSVSRVLTTADEGSGNGIDADTLDGVQGASFLRSDANDTAVGDLTLNGTTTFNSGAAGAATIGANGDIRFSNGNWTGESCKIQQHGNYLYIAGGSNGIFLRDDNAGNRWLVDSSGHFRPATDSSFDIGSNSDRVRNLYADTYYGDGSNLTGISSTNNFVNSASFNTGNGVLTLGRSGLGNVTVDLDGRFATGTIPTNNNQLSNGRGFITSSGNTEGYAKTLKNSRTGSAPNYALRGWVNFDGRGSISIRGNGNVSSISDFGTGHYRVNFSTSMADGNYSTTTLGGYDQTGGLAPFIIFSNGGFDGSPLQYNSSGVRCGSTYADFRYATLMFAR